MPVTRNTNWRHIGAVPYDTWKRLITNAGGTPAVAAKSVWEAYGDDSALALAFLEKESSYASNYDANPASNKNPWNLQYPDPPRRFLEFATYEEGAKAWRDRLYSKTYKGGVYDKTTSIYSLISTYAPKSDGNDTEGYTDGVVADINEYGYGPVVSAPGDPPVVDYNYSKGVHPAVKDIAVSEGNKFAGYIAPASHVIRALVIHSAYGYLIGTTGYFQQGNALTDYMVGNSSDNDPSLDGQLRRFNDPVGPRYSWSSGPVNNPIEDAAKFLEIYGPNKEVVNMYTTALERSGDSRNAVTEKEHAKRVALIAYWANEYGKYLFGKTGEHRFTADTFPLIPPENNRSFLIYHGEINADKRTSCPDAAVRSTLDRIIADVKTLLSTWQKGTGTTPTDPPVDPPGAYAKPKVIEELQAYKDANAAPAYATVGTDTFVFVNDRVRATKATPRYQTASTGAEKIGADIEKGLEFAVLWLFFDEKKEPWYITPYWTRVRASDTERIGDTP